MVSIEDCREKALEKGGRCLSTEYVNNHTYMEWECDRGHKWSATWASVGKKKKGTWCKKCSGKAKLTLEECQESAKKKGGRCLSTVYKNLREPMEWECKNGHRWPTAFGVIKSGSWCEVCIRPGVLDTIETCREFAVTKRGKCLSEAYKDKETDMEWECEHGHRWPARWGSIKRGTWCRLCAMPGYGYTLETVQVYAEGKGGKCLSTEYISVSETMEFECQAGHRFKNCYQNMRNRGDWCRVCAGYQILDLKFCQEIAIERKGKCLSTEYKNKEEYMDWECEHGHTWPARFGKIYHGGRWCPTCVNKTEAKVYDFLKDKYDDLGRQFKPEWLLNTETGCYFSFDFVLEKLRVVIEVDGRQHFEDVKFFKNDAEKNVKRDVEKMVKAVENNYRVIRLHQEDVWEDKSNWREWLLEKISLDDCRVSFPEKEEYCLHQELWDQCIELL
jgi:hypothetical protein